MLAPAALHALCGRHAEAGTAHFLLPLEIGRLVIGTRIPDEVEVQRVLEVIALGVPLPPRLGLFTVECLQDGIKTVLFAVVACDQIADTFGNLKSRLQSHGAFR